MILVGESKIENQFKLKLQKPFKTFYSYLKISSDDLTKLLKFATCETHFLFNGKFYDQIDLVAIGSPLAPVLANIFTGHNKEF